MRRLLLGLGAIATITTPVIVAVSCGAEVSGKVAWKRSDNTAQLNLNVQNVPSPFSQYESNGAVNVLSVARDFEAAIVQNNVGHLKEGEEVIVEMTIQYTVTGTIGPDELIPPVTTYKRSIKYKFQFQYTTKANPKITDYSEKPLLLKTNFAPIMMKALYDYGISNYTTAGGVKTPKEFATDSTIMLKGNDQFKAAYDLFVAKGTINVVL